MSVSEIMELLGGTTAVARYTGWPVSTVDSWIGADQVPEWRKGKLLEMAVVQGKPLGATDFPPKKERRAAA